MTPMLTQAAPPPRRRAPRASIWLVPLALAVCGDPPPEALVDADVSQREAADGEAFLDCSDPDADLPPTREEVAACLEAAWAACQPAWARLGWRWIVIDRNPSGVCEATTFVVDTAQEHLVQSTCRRLTFSADTFEEFAASECDAPWVRRVDLIPAGC